MTDFLTDKQKKWVESIGGQEWENGDWFANIKDSLCMRISFQAIEYVIEVRDVTDFITVVCHSCDLRTAIRDALMKYKYMAKIVKKTVDEINEFWPETQKLED